jgi:small basic protein
MVTKTSLIFRDIMYAILIVVLLLPSNPLGVTLLLKVLAIVFAVGVRIWQHVNYYKETGKIY